MASNRTMSTIQSSSDSSDDDSVSATEHHDDEINIRALPINTRFGSFPPFIRDFIHGILRDMKEGKKGWVQVLTIYAAAILTYGCSNAKIDRMEMNVQVATMTVITLVGASPFLSTHLLPATMGAFVGGHKIIGSVGSMDDVIVVTWTNYAWLFLLSFVVGLTWRFVMNSKWKVLDGFSGRPGTTVFLGMNLVTLTVYGPLGVVGWNRYYYGLTEVLNSAEDSIPLARAWFEEAELAIGYVFAVISVGVVGGGSRVLHNDYVKRFDETNKDSPTMPSPLPLNNILVPVLWALLSMLLVMVSGYEHASVLFNGFAVGSYVAVASLRLIPSIAKFAIVSVIAAGWGLALTPFFVGFPGKCGFTAMLGHVTWCLIERVHGWLQVHRKSHERHRRKSCPYDDNVYTQRDQGQQREMIDQEAPDSPAADHFKQKTLPIKNHPRRQQRKSEGGEGIEDPPKLHHRAWSAVKAEADDWRWHHTLEPRQTWNSLV